MTSIKHKIKQIYRDFEPYRNIIWFLILFIGIDFLWKMCFDDGEDKSSLLFLGYNLTNVIQPLCVWTAKVTHWMMLHIFGYPDFKINGTNLFFEGSMRFNVVWECTGVKEMLFFAILIGFYFGPPKKKIWFIPVSMLVLNIVNILRIAGIMIVTKDGFPDWFIGFNEWYNGKEWDTSGNNSTYWEFYYDWFELFHKDVFRWLYYNGVVFLLWLAWEEVFNLPYQRLKKTKKAP